MVIVNGLVKNFRKKRVLSHVTFEIENQVLGVLGPNGSGKTTLFRILAGLLEKSDGEIKYSNWDGLPVSLKECQIGYLPQSFGLIKNYTLYEHMKYFACLKDIPKNEWEEAIQTALEAVHLIEMKDMKCGRLSGGMVRRAGIAQAIMGSPDLVLFDEPTAGLDPEERIRFQNTINASKGQYTIMISTHIINDIARVCDKTLVIKNGTVLYQGKTNRLASLARKYDNTEAVSLETQIEDGYMYLLKSEQKNGKAW